MRGATDSNKPLVETVLAHFGIKPDDIDLTEALIADAETSLVQRKADALVLVAPPAGRGVRNLVANLAEAKTRFTFIQFPVAEALVARFPFLQAMTVSAGIFGGMPPQPSSPIESVSITYELVASSALSERAVASLTKSLLAVR